MNILLTRLYAHEDWAVSDLEKVRINPEGSTEVWVDLEFFIPQVCIFYLEGESDEKL